jgi:tyrosyl-tRNA synthetase
LVRTTDVDALSYIKIFTLLNEDEINEIEKKHNLKPSDRLLQKVLAKDITIRVHGINDFIKAEEKSGSLFSFNKESLMELKRTGSFVDALEKYDAPVFRIHNSILDSGINIVDLLVHENTGIMPSKGEARKMIANGGIYVDFDKITDPNFTINRGLNLVNDYVLLQKGKKNFYWINFI